MTYAEYINKYKDIDKDVLICACMNIIENNNVNIDNIINTILKEKEEYNESQKVMNKLTEKPKIDGYNNGEIFYDVSLEKMYMMYNGEKINF